MAYQTVLVTHESYEGAKKMAEMLVEEGLCACVNLIKGVESIYRFEGALCRDAEVLMVIKSVASHYKALEARIQALHPYKVPEIIALDIVQGSEAYLAWLGDSLAVSFNKE